MLGAATCGSSVEEVWDFDGDADRSILRFGRGGMTGRSLPNVLPLPPAAGAAGAGLLAWLRFGLGGIGGRPDIVAARCCQSEVRSWLCSAQAVFNVSLPARETRSESRTSNFVK